MTTHDKTVFSWNPDSRPCNGFDDVLHRYRTIAPHVQLAGESCSLGEHPLGKQYYRSALQRTEQTGAEALLVEPWLCGMLPCAAS